MRKQTDRKYRIATDGQLYYLQKRFTFFGYIFWRTVLTDALEERIFNHANTEL
jgi:hypothetical protein